MSSPSTSPAATGTEPEAAGFAAVVARIITRGRLDRPRTHRVVAAVLALLVLACVAGSITRQSLLPLLPIPLYLLGALGWAQVRRVAGHQRLLVWWCVLLTGLLAGFWLMGFVANNLDR